MGGFIAEKLLNYYVAMLMGSIFLIIGSFTMTCIHSENILFLGLGFISIGSGLIKSNASSFIGSFYDRIAAKEGGRDFGFNVFYVGLNLGIIGATFFIYFIHAVLVFVHAVIYFIFIIYSLLRATSRIGLAHQHITIYRHRKYLYCANGNFSG